MKTIIMFVLIVFMSWVLYSVSHATRPDLTVVGVDDYSHAEDMAVLYAPEHRSRIIVKSDTMRNTYCVWYVAYYELPDFVWEEVKRQGMLKCDK